MDESQKSSVSSKLTLREKKVVAGVMAGQSVQRAAQDAGYSDSVSKSHIYKSIKSHRVQSFFTDALEHMGLTPALIVKPVFDAIQATMIVKVKSRTGEFKLVTDYPDHHLRLEAFDRIERLYGVSLNKSETPQPAKGSLTVVIVKASDLERAQASQKQKAIEINPKKTLNVSIIKKVRVPTV